MIAWSAIDHQWYHRSRHISFLQTSFVVLHDQRHTKLLPVTFPFQTIASACCARAHTYRKHAREEKSRIRTRWRSVTRKMYYVTRSGIARKFIVSFRVVFSIGSRGKRTDLSRPLRERDKLWLITRSTKWAGFLKDCLDRCLFFRIAAARLSRVDSTFVPDVEYSEVLTFASDIVIYDDQPPVPAAE